MKSFNLKLLALLSVGSIFFASGCAKSAQGLVKGASLKSKVNTVCQDVSYIQADSKPIDIKNTTLTSFPKNTVECFGFVDNENVIILTQGSEQSLYTLCLYNINTKKSKEIGKGKDICFNSLSKDNKKILYTSDFTCHVYDIEKTSNKIIIKNCDISNPIFTDYAGRYVLSLGNKNFKLLDTKTSKIKNCNIPDGEWEIDLGNGCFSSDKFYFNGVFNKRIGIYSLDIKSMNKIEPVLLLPKEDNHAINQFDFINNGKSIIFSGNYEKHPGIYIYDLDTKKIKKVASGFVSETKNKGIFYSISNDKTKILVECFVNNNKNSSIYLSEINKNNLTSTKCLYKKHPNTYGALLISSWWSQDDSFFLIDEKETTSSQKEWIFDKIRKLNIKDNK